jgi:two-component system, chemotaxis family, chemotaxis protein CheY
MRTLLLIDDDADVREAFTDLFAFRGWTVVGACDGLEALEWLAAHEAPDVILLDLKMPRCDGYEFRERQLADARLKDLPTVVFTADAHIDDVYLPLLGDLPVVRKSLEFADLLALVERMSRPG